MSSSQYTLPNSADHASARLKALASLYDPLSHRVLNGIGVAAGWTCLDVGAGNGSMATWLSRKVGPQGRVTAVDLDVTALATLASGNIEVVQRDIRYEQSGGETFDVIHARMVLSHLDERDEVLGALIKALTPGGWVIISEPRNYPAPAGTAQEIVSSALTRSLQQRGQDVDWIWRVPTMLSKEKLDPVGISCDTPVVQGGSAGADFAYVTAVQLKEQGMLPEISTEDLAQWQRETQDPGLWRPQTSLISTWGQRPV